MPSPRDIPEVKRVWHKIPYDKFIVKYMSQPDAYRIARDFFLEHTEYDYFVVCPDDLELNIHGVNQLIEDVRLGFIVISGICNIDETQPDTYAIQPTSCDYSREGPAVSYGSWYMKDKEPKIPDNDIFQVGHSGFCCEFIPREVMEKVSWVGATLGGTGNFDWQFSKDCHEIGIPIMVDKRANFWHRRNEQIKQAKAPKIGDQGYTIWLKDR